MKRKQNGLVVYTMVVAVMGAGLTAIGTFDNLSTCKNEIVRLETEDKAIAAANPTAQTAQVWRRCQRKT